MRQRLAWLSAAPLMAAGLLAGHYVGYRLAIPDADARAHALQHSGHGYLAYAPLALAICLSLVLVALVLRVHATLDGEPRRSAPPIAFAFLPPVAFLLQEHLERLVHSGAVPWAATLEPPVLIGLALQLPFALAALVLVQLLDWLAHTVGVALAAERPRYALRPPAFAVVAVARLPRVEGLGRGYGERAPPFAPQQ